MFPLINKASRYAEVAPALLNLTLTCLMFFSITDPHISYGVFGICVLHLGAGGFALINDFLDPLSKAVSWALAVVMIVAFIMINSTAMLITLMVINIFATLIQALLMWREVR